MTEQEQGCYAHEKLSLAPKKMYIPAAFKVTQTDQLVEFIRNNPLATLITDSSGILEANHIPLLIFERDNKHFFAGHMARANSVWREHPVDHKVLAIFSSHSEYISPSWYASKAEHHKAVPTWNYIAVHASGKIRFIEDTEWLLQHLEAMTIAQESKFEIPWRLEDAPADYVQKMTQAIVGFEIEITQLIGKKKLSQNRTLEDRESVVHHLKINGKFQMAELIQEASAEKV